MTSLPPALTRAGVPAPALPRQAVPVPSLGGSVIVCCLTLRERHALVRQFAALAEAAGKDHDTAAAQDIAGHAVSMQLMAACVIDGSGQPLWSAEQWERFAAISPGEFTTVLLVALRFADFAAVGDHLAALSALPTTSSGPNLELVVDAREESGSHRMH